MKCSHSEGRPWGSKGRSSPRTLERAQLCQFLDSGFWILDSVRVYISAVLSPWLLVIYYSGHRKLIKGQYKWVAGALNSQLWPSLRLTFACPFPGPQFPYVENKLWRDPLRLWWSMDQGFRSAALNFPASGQWVGAVIIRWPLSWQNCLKMNK